MHPTRNSTGLIAVTTLFLLLVGTDPTAAQRGPNQTFHSTQSANLPTAETVNGGLWMFEISHRFEPPISSGASSLWGFDGPVFNRLGLTFAPSDRVMLGVLRTNLLDNLELNGKVKLWEQAGDGVRYKAAVMAGAAANFGASEVDTPTARVENDEAQFYAQLILNARFGDRLAVGVVPTVLRNPVIEDLTKPNALALGLHAQVYTDGPLSFLVEWIASEASAAYPTDAVTFGVEAETRGHFFKILVTNQVRMNPTHFLAGTFYGRGSDDWRFGFNITRLLAL